VLEDAKPLRLSLKLWDVATGKELDSVSGGKNEFFTSMAFHMAYSINPRLLAVGTINVKEKSKLILFDTSRNRLDRLYEIEFQAALDDLAFSNEGHWLAVVTQDRRRSSWHNRALSDFLEFEQPRIQLIEAATGKLQETLVAPQGYAAPICFGPDGATLAVPGRGRVLLFDLSPNSAGSGRR
jgi:WD40 repeat protein